MQFTGKKILIILHGSIGDVARALPLANLLRHAYPGTRITWSIEPPALPLVENHPAIDEILVFDRKKWRHSLFPFLGQIRSGAFELVLDLQRHLKSGLISWWTGAPLRLGFHRLDSKEGNWLFNNHHIGAVGDGISKLSHYLKFAEFLGISPEPIVWGIRCTPQEEKNVTRHLALVGDRFAAFFLGARWESKRWFPYQAAMSASEVHKRFGLNIVLLGGVADIPLAHELEGYGMVPLKNCVGVCSLRESVEILARAQVAVGPDTGLMHLSAAVETPVVSLWGATNPIRTGPFGFENLILRGKADCSPCNLKRCAIGRICMQSIEIDDIVSKVGEALAEGKAKRVAGW